MNEQGLNGEDGLLARMSRAVFTPPRYRWWHAVAFEAAAQLVVAPGFRNTGGPQTYKSFKQASFAPPSWVFGPAWAINNVSVLWGNLRLLNVPAGTPYRRPLLWLQGGSWLLFSTFSYAYFGLQSPIMAFAWTSGMYLLTIGSAILASKVDPKIAASLITLLLWLSLASVVAAYQMVYNADPFFGTPAWR